MRPSWYPDMHPCQGACRNNSSKRHKLILCGLFPAWTGGCKGVLSCSCRLFATYILWPSIRLSEKNCCTAAALPPSFQVVSMRLGMVDLSCYSLEEVPEHLFYSQDIIYLNLRHNFMRSSGAGSLDSLCRSAKNYFSSSFGVLDMCIQG